MNPPVTFNFKGVSFEMCAMKNSNNSNDEFDRISSLPNEMLQHILSFLRIREAVQTSLVSKRWVNLWTSLSRLNFDQREFVSIYRYHHSTLDRKIALDTKFTKFVEKLLSCHEASFLDTIMIKIPDKSTYACANLASSCADYAMKFNARVFYMEVPFIHISEFFFSSESIEEMCLRTSCKTYFHKIPDIVNLPRIRRFQLTNSRLDTKCITRLFSGCPVLEDVSLERCFGEFSCIFSQKLKYLSLRDCFLFLGNNRFMSVRSCQRDKVESAFGINREYPFNVDFVWKTVSTIAVGNSFSFMQNFFRCVDLGDYFGGLSDVTVLELQSEDMMYILEAALPKLGEFHNIMNLCLGSWCMICNLSPVTLFLQQTPNLHKITLHISARHCRGEETDIHQMMDHFMWVHLSPYKNLKQVDIKLLKDYIGAHKIDKASLPNRKQFDNIEIVIIA